MAKTGRIRVLVGAAFLVLVGLGAQVAGSAVQAAVGSLLFRDRFDRFGLVNWPQLQKKGPWYVQYSGYGSVGTVLDGGSTALRLKPKAATRPGVTHAGFVTSNKTFRDIDARVSMRTEKQLRTGTRPNAWEVAWFAWNYRHDHHFYYVILKPNGFEVGKVDNRKRNPNGPACLWPAYRNCFYPGAQKYLVTKSTPKFPVGPAYDLRVRQVGKRMRFWVDGKYIATYADRVRPFRSGSIGLYTEDADARFDDVVVRRP